MKRIILFLLLTGIMCQAAPVELDNNARLKIDDLLFMVDFRLNNKNYGQGTKYFKAAKPEKDSATKINSEIFLPEQPYGTMTTSLKTDSGGFTYESVIEFSAPVKFPGITLRAALPADIYNGRELIADGKKIKLPLEPEKVHIYNGKCSKLEIPGNDGTIILQGDITFHLHDYRPRPNHFSIMIRFSPGSGNITNASLKLQISRSQYQSTPLDLRAAANMGFADDKADDDKGGWSDQGPDNDLRMIPVGKQRWHGINFDIIDPAKNQKKSCIMLAGQNREYFAEKAGCDQPEGIQGQYLYLLHALAWPSKEDAVGDVIISYRDGTSTSLPIVRNRDVGNWWAPSPRSNGEVAWIGENRSSYVGLFRSVFTIENKPLKRIDFKSARKSVWGVVAASVADQQVPKPLSPPYYIVAGHDWQAIDYIKDIEPGSVFDFSSRLDAPAGKHGPVVIKNGKFVFRDKPETPVRFYGTNLCSSASYINKEWAERLADRMAAFGFNAIRLHHHDGGMVKREKTTELDPVKIDQLDYLVHCFKKRGIYITTDLYISRRLPKGEIPEYPSSMPNIAVYKALFWILDSVYENWQAYSRNYLNHVNPYTGLTIKDDPALISISLINEGNIKSQWNADAFTTKLYQEKFEQWLTKNNHTPNSTFERNQYFSIFLTETYNKRYAQMVNFVRELGVKCPLTDQNMGSTQKLSVMRNQYDYVDNHSYWSHPQFAEKSWQLPSLLNNHSGVGANALAQGRLFPSRIYGKPFAVTEFDAANPNRYRAEAPALYGAYGALQGWDMLFQFAYTHGTAKFMRDDQTSGYFDLATDIVKALSQRIGVVLFNDGGVKTAASNITIPVKDTPELSFDSPYSAEFQQLGLVTGVGSVINPANTPDNRIPGKEFYDPDNGIFRSVTKQIELNSKKETFKVVSPTCETIILPAGQSEQGNFLKVANKIGRGVFSTIAADGKPLHESKRILILHLTDTQATKTKFATPQMARLESWGTTPFLAARGEAELTLSIPPGTHYKLYAVNTAGKRLGEISLTSGSFKASVFSPYGSIMAYELIKREIK